MTGKRQFWARLVLFGVLFALSFGGSLGASEINRCCIDAMRRLSSKEDVWHMHGTGARYYEELIKRDPSLKDNRFVVPYIEQMPLYMSAANLILSRAGAITLAEISRLGRAAILVPSPNVSGDHQRVNAYAYQRKNAAWVMEEKHLSGLAIAAKVLSLQKNKGNILSAEKAAKQFDKEDTPKLFEAVFRGLFEK